MKERAVTCDSDNYMVSKGEQIYSHLTVPMDFLQPMRVSNTKYWWKSASGVPIFFCIAMLEYVAMLYGNRIFYISSNTKWYAGNKKYIYLQTAETEVWIFKKLFIKTSREWMSMIRWETTSNYCI